jgi:hypothetical protein
MVAFEESLTVASDISNGENVVLNTMRRNAAQPSCSLPTSELFKGEGTSQQQKTPKLSHSDNKHLHGIGYSRLVLDPLRPFEIRARFLRLLVGNLQLPSTHFMPDSFPFASKANRNNHDFLILTGSCLYHLSTFNSIAKCSSLLFKPHHSTPSETQLDHQQWRSPIESAI